MTNNESEIQADIAVKLLTAIAHKGRLSLMRLLVQAGPTGVVAGELARAAGVGATTASAQLQVLGNANLVTSQRDGRQIIYRANYPALEGLLGYLLEDCCGGRAEICKPIARRLRLSKSTLAKSTLAKSTQAKSTQAKTAQASS